MKLFLVIFLCLTVGQYASIYYEWLKFKGDKQKDKEDNFIYFFKCKIASLLARQVLVLFVVAFFALTGFHETVFLKVNYWVWMLYFVFGVSFDASLKALIAKGQKVKESALK